MTEIKLTLEDPAKTVELLKRAARYASSDGWDGDSSQHASWLARQIANSIEEQVKPTTPEPEGFGSIVRARDHGEPMLWQKTPMHGKHYWESETGAVEVWPELTDVEVLRVGVGEAEDTATEEPDRRWWVCTYWLQLSSSATQEPGVKIAGPFRDREEAIENRARIETYTGNLTFYIDEAKP